MKQLVLQPKFSPESGLVTVTVMAKARGFYATTGSIPLMTANANEEAFGLTLATGFAHFWSRSRQVIWKKGGTSGYVIPVYAIMIDCDQDALIYYTDVDVERFKACHMGVLSCYSFNVTAVNPSSSMAMKEYEVHPNFD